MKVRDSYAIGSSANVVFNIDEPDRCPICQHAIKPVLLSRNEYKSDIRTGFFTYVYRCAACNRAFMTLYQCDYNQFANSFEDPTRLYIAPVLFRERQFEERIFKLSPNFVRVYNQALQAETENLDEIAGMGLRKALEFLIKDYLISLNPSDEETIKRMELGNCIANKVTNESIKAVASRSAWIGNDFTHYTRRFENHDIADLHDFIDAVVYWINMELITNKARQIQPQGRS